MIEGLDERERLRTAFGAFVDPGLAERVTREGSDLAGEEVEVSVLFLDIRDFTAFADQVLITKDTRRRLRTQGFELDERKAVELKGKQVPVPLWAPRAYPADASFHDRAGASVAD
jgi:class 3 adenylate cyclase